MEINNTCMCGMMMLMLRQGKKSTSLFHPKSVSDCPFQIQLRRITTYSTSSTPHYALCSTLPLLLYDIHDYKSKMIGRWLAR